MGKIMKNKKNKPNIISHESINPKQKTNDKIMIKHLKDELREYKRQIKVLKRTIEGLMNEKSSHKSSIDQQ